MPLPEYGFCVGFSIIGLAVSVAVLLPNLLLVVFPPRPSLPTLHVPAALRWAERAGQALCLTLPALTAPGAITPGWAAPTGAAVFGYWMLWMRYLRRRSPASLFGDLRGVPVPMALLPVSAFLSCALLLGNPWIAAAAALLAIGHIPASMLRARSIDAS